MSFEHFSLDPRVLAGAQAAGYSVPTPIQKAAVPHVLAGRDVLGLAQTGTGKTAAFVLPILHRLVDGPSRRVRALILAPTRELAEQINEAVGELGAATGVRGTAVYGGVSKGRQLEALRRGAQILTSCPGRLIDHLNEGTIDLAGVEVLVLDEADRMCDMGFMPDIRRILARLPRRRQTLFFSATMPSEIRQLSAEILNNPIEIQVDRLEPARTVSHALYPAPEGAKPALLLALLETTACARVLVFTRTKHRARSLARSLEKAGHRACALQGNMTQNNRRRSIDGFRDGTFDVLVATDIAARGIDVPEISHVINFDVPDTVEAYTHRIGRTGRAERNGEAFTLACREDALMIRDIEKTLRARMERRRLDGFDYQGLPDDILDAAPRNPARAVPGGTRQPGQQREHPAGRPNGRLSPPSRPPRPRPERRDRARQGRPTAGHR